MKLSLGPSGRLELSIGEDIWIEDIGVRLFQDGEWLSDASGVISGKDWEQVSGSAAGREFIRLRREYSYAGTPWLEMVLHAYSDLILITVVAHRDITGISRGDSFTTPGVLLPHFRLAPDLGFFLTTFGLGGEDDGYPGGYWPTAKLGRGMRELPDEAFAPLVVYDDENAVAIAPGNLFLTSPLVKTPDGVGRGLHGAVERIPAGTRLETLIAWGNDITAALMRLGDHLLSRSGKERPIPGSHPALSKLGWWNAYGGYYTEPIRRLDEKGLTEVLNGLKKLRIPLGYIGLDLWYPYAQIGQALEYVPDPKKYPRGIGEIAASAGLSTVLHLSALSQENAYGTDGSDPGFYRKVAASLVRERAIVAWHDWLRTQQHLTRRLRAEPTAAEAWFDGMAEAFAADGLDVLLCMQTMGMNLAATQHLNVIAGRVHTDYLFSQPEALDEAERRGHPELKDGFVPPHELHRQNLLMGLVLYSLGMAPFHDLFLTRKHPGLGGDHPEEEAILRALSCGPVGIGDGPGMTDPGLVQRLLLPDGTIARPDHPPFPLWSTVNDDVVAFLTEHRAGEAVWGYLILLNTTAEEAEFSLAPPLPGEHLIWDGLQGEVVPELRGTIPPGRIAYFVLVPQEEGIAPLGSQGMFVPGGVVKEAVWNRGWHLRLASPAERLMVVSAGPIGARTDRGRELVVEKGEAGVWAVSTQEDRDVHIYRR